MGRDAGHVDRSPCARGARATETPQGMGSHMNARPHARPRHEHSHWVPERRCSDRVAYLDDARTRGESFAISVITEIELLASPALESGDELLIDRLLASLEIVWLHSTLARSAAALRRDVKLKLGDAVVAATAQARYATLVTRDRDLARRAQQCKISVQRL